MSRYTGPTTRISRRFGQPIFGTNKSFEKKPYPPGIHGPRLRRKLSDYAIGLNEKQKLRFTYGLTEKQFLRTFDRARRERGITGDRFLQLLETRLDNVIYLLGFAKSRQAARQFVNHGHIRVNGGKVDIPSYTVKAGDEIEVRSSTSSRQLATRNLDETRLRVVPAWLTLQEDTLRATVNRLPDREEIDPGVNEQLVVEFYSR
ncbi:MAG TPA: 30S ribosomal protein S4 [Opitutales bacterium]|nr:30S ribosomal protein S4 [Opitutales bacterium]